MNFQTNAWVPVHPSTRLSPAREIAAVFLNGHEIALWRDASGRPQAWENRCPHRGARLTLGRIIHNHLSCAYHGWEFEANSGRCGGIPAHPSQTPPKNACVKTYACMDKGGMIWVKRLDLHDAGEAEPPDTPKAGIFCRSLGLKTDVVAVVEELEARGFRVCTPNSWSGRLASTPVIAMVSYAKERLTFVHIWAQSNKQPIKAGALFPALVAFRAAAESRMSAEISS
ncbi:MAG: Rieske 2Fe-2S domain-containing protein [Proteobacteria bacterium]|uniref:Rieske 2Fe-2S domain-containing protein n=1 Tax=Zoogloea sp. LCSB751 TaxID=1965277 RepID=UPI0009A54740|nr:Rieske 2Fe-2S domain-containing protein [Zoogloea sp. LCSB751]MBS0353524.1 Rieske 2Fe-2S domain-containing protein [Pseudomonadota bacterium]